MDGDSAARLTLAAVARHRLTTIQGMTCFMGDSFAGGWIARRRYRGNVTVVSPFGTFWILFVPPSRTIPATRQAWPGDSFRSGASQNSGSTRQRAQKCQQIGLLLRREIEGTHLAIVVRIRISASA